MKWIKEASKLGKYETTHSTFRIYCTKNPEIKQSLIEKYGEEWRRTDIIPGYFVAVDKYGVKFEGTYIDELYFKIDIEMIARQYDKKEEQSYTTGVSLEGEAYIECLICLRKSFNPNDVKFKYCVHCHKFHEP